VKIPFGQRIAVGRKLIDLEPELVGATLQTIKAGWQIAIERIQARSYNHEVEITECLRDGMRKALECGDLAQFRPTMIVAPGTESRSEPDMPVPDGRTDIPLYFWKVTYEIGEHDPHAIIECKRVAERDSTLAREYVLEGVDRFCTGKYAANHSRAFMAGYVLLGTPSGAVAGINRYLNRHHRVSERLKPSTNCDWTWRSEHPRSTTPVELHHAMLALATTLNDTAAGSARTEEMTQPTE